MHFIVFGNKQFLKNPAAHSKFSWLLPKQYNITPYLRDLSNVWILRKVTKYKDTVWKSYEKLVS